MSEGSDDASLASPWLKLCSWNLVLILEYGCLLRVGASASSSKQAVT
jgi:hypothetical protein